MKLSRTEAGLLAAIGLIMAVVFFGARHPRARYQPTSGDNTECANGIALYRGEILIVNNETVKCKMSQGGTE